MDDPDRNFQYDCGTKDFDWKFPVKVENSDDDDVVGRVDIMESELELKIDHGDDYDHEYFHSITVIAEFSNRSFEELRIADLDQKKSTYGTGTSYIRCVRVVFCRSGRNNWLFV